MGYASDKFASITRQQFADWQQRFLPKQQELMSLATDDSLMNAQLNRTAVSAENAVQTAQQAQTNSMARMGVANTTDANDNSTGMSRALAVAAAKNGTRTDAEERNLSILAGEDARKYATALTMNQ